MTKHEFIFSHQRSHRIARHLIFWALWSVAFNLLFHFPIHVFKGWDVSGPGTENYRALGPVLFFIKALIVNSFLAVIVPQIALTYVLIYWLLPNYYFKKRNYLITAVTTVFVLLCFYFLAVSCKHIPAIYNKIAWNSNSLWPFLDTATQRVVITDQLTSLPVILGFALMIKLAKKWWVKQKETEQLSKEKLKAELQLLKAQVHPHFLFNTLNNIYFFTLTNSVRAPEMIKKLSGILHYIIYECNSPFVSLEKEINMIRDYMALEKIRYAEQMQMTIEITGNQSGKIIVPLLLIPFVENSFKHGASKMITQPWVKLQIKTENDKLWFCIMNSRPSISDSITVKGNIGLNNVKKRLELLYAGTHELTIVSDKDSYTVNLSLQLKDSKDNINAQRDINPLREYALA